MNRMCCTENGRPKLAYATFDEAMAIAVAMRQPVHCYRCPEHGWHVGRNR